jgi:hypothetical protein
MKTAIFAAVLLLACTVAASAQFTRLNGRLVWTTGHMLFSPDNASDIGASGATRPRTIYAATSVNVGSGVYNGDSFRLAATLFANLGTPSNGLVMYCSDCTKATPCAGAGTGAIAKRLNGAWDCD